MGAAGAGLSEHLRTHQAQVSEQGQGAMDQPAWEDQFVGVFGLEALGREEHTVEQPRRRR